MALLPSSSIEVPSTSFWMTSPAPKSHRIPSSTKKEERNFGAAAADELFVVGLFPASSPDDFRLTDAVSCTKGQSKPFRQYPFRKNRHKGLLDLMERFGERRGAAITASLLRTLLEWLWARVGPHTWSLVGLGGHVMAQPFSRLEFIFVVVVPFLSNLFVDDEDEGTAVMMFSYFSMTWGHDCVLQGTWFFFNSSSALLVTRFIAISFRFSNEAVDDADFLLGFLFFELVIRRFGGEWRGGLLYPTSWLRCVCSCFVGAGCSVSFVRFLYE